MNIKSLSSCICLLDNREQPIINSISEQSTNCNEFFNKIEQAILNGQFLNIDSYHIISFMFLMAGRRKSLYGILKKLVEKYPSLKIELLSLSSYVREKNLQYEMWYDQIDILIRRMKGTKKSKVIAEALKIIGQILIWNRFDAVEREPQIFSDIDELMKECSCFSIIKSILFAFYAYAYHQLGKTELSLHMLSNAEELMGDCIIEKSQIMNLKSIILGELGRVEESIEAARIAYETRMELGNEVGASATLNNMAMQYWSIGDIKKASAQLNNVIKVLKQHNIPIVIPLLNLALISIGEGNYEDALKYAEQAKNHAKVMGISHIGIPLVLAQAHIYLKQFDEAKRYIDDYKKLMDKSETKRDIYYYHYLLGLFEKSRLNLYTATNEFIKAIKIAEDLNMISEIIDAKIKFAETMLQKYILLKDIAFVQIAEAHIEDARLICEEQELDRQFYYIVKLSVYLETILNNKKKAKDIVNEAIAKFDKNSNIQKKLIKLRDEIKKASPKRDLESIIRNFTDNAQKLLQIHIFKKPKKISFKLLGCIIMMKSSGLAVISKIYDKKISTDSNLVAGLISAVSTFLQQISHNESEGNLKSILHENISILIETDEQFSYLLLVDHETYEARKLLRRISETFKMSYPTIENWDGNLSVFKNAEHILSPIISEFIE